MYPKSFFKKHGHNPTNGTCFVLMPFDKSFDDVYATLSQTLEGSALNFSCRRADEIFGGGHIIEGILQSIGETEIIIADLTGRNPNVFYELGITHMVKEVEKVLIVSQDISDIPFDLKQYRCVRYEQSAIGLRNLKKDLEKAIKAISRTPYRFNVGIGENYEFPNKLLGEDRASYYFAISQIDLGGGYVKFYFETFRYTRGKTTQIDSKYYSLEQGRTLPINSKIPWLLSLEEVSIPTRRAYFKVIGK